MFKKNKDKMYKSIFDYIQFCCKVLRYICMLLLLLLEMKIIFDRY